MKYLLLLILISFFFFGCIEEEINPQDIVGKWTSTGISQKLERDGITWSNWAKTGQIDKSHFFEFRQDGTYDYAPRSSFDSCFYGNKYITRVAESDIWVYYTDVKRPSKYDCGLIDIIFTWNFIDEVSGDTLIKRLGDSRLKYIRIK
jgi:hypothetical protein